MLRGGGQGDDKNDDGVDVTILSQAEFPNGDNTAKE